MPQVLTRLRDVPEIETISVFVHMHAMGSGTLADPWVGWDTAITWSPDVHYKFIDGVFATATGLTFSFNRLYLDGSSRSILRYTGSSTIAAVIHQDGTAAPASGGVNQSYLNYIGNLFIDGGGHATDLIRNTRSHRSKYENIRGTNSISSGTEIRLRGVSYCWLINCKFLDQGERPDSGSDSLSFPAPTSEALTTIRIEADPITSDSSTQIEIVNLQAGRGGGGSPPANSIGLDIVAGVNIHMIGGDLEPYDIPIRIATNCDFNLFEKVDTEASTTGIQISSSRNRFIGCNVQGDIDFKSGATYNKVEGGWARQLIFRSGTLYNESLNTRWDLAPSDSGTHNYVGGRNGLNIYNSATEMFLDGGGHESGGVLNVNNGTPNDRMDVWSDVLARKALRSDGGLNLQPTASEPFYGTGDISPHPNAAGDRYLTRYRTTGGTDRWLMYPIGAGGNGVWTDATANNAAMNTTWPVAAGGTGVSTFGATNSLLYTTAANTLSNIATANSSVLVTNGSGAPSWSTSLTLSGAVLGSNIIETVGITIDGGGAALTTGSKGFRQFFTDGTIQSWTILADQSGSCVVDVKKSTYAGFPSTSSIAASAKPTLSSAQKNTDSTLTGWTTAITAGDIFEFNVDSATTVTRVTVLMKIKRA